MKLIKRFDTTSVFKILAAIFTILGFVMFLPKQILVDMGPTSISFGMEDLSFITGGIYIGYILALITGLVIIFSTIFEFENKMADLIFMIAVPVLLALSIVMMQLIPTMITNSVGNAVATNERQLWVIENILIGTTTKSAGPKLGTICCVVSLISYANNVVIKISKNLDKK